MTAENVRLVVWDLDETFWKGTLTEGGIQEYSQANHDIVIELARRGIMSSICSKNDPAAILPILEEKGILEYFIFPSISWESKGVRLANLVETVQLRAETIMFVDDNPSSRAEAAVVVPGLQIADETIIPHMLQDPRFSGKEDSQLTRLKQYKLLEKRKRDSVQSAGNNESFLRGCDIRVCIEYDIDANIDRAIELINRTNQLNYTKQRLSEDQDEARQQLREQLKPFDRVAGLVRVADKYGDYGFVGFFMAGGIRRNFVEGAANTKLLHYCFSCRTLGMFVEYWLYHYLDRPELDIVGEVVTNLSETRVVDWVKLVPAIDNVVQAEAEITPQVVLYAGCEANVIGVYLQRYSSRVDVYGNYVSNDIFVRVNFAARLADVCDRNTEEFAAEAQVLGLPLHLESGDIFASAMPGAIFVLNFGADAHGIARIRHKNKRWIFSLAPDHLGGGMNLDSPVELLAEHLDQLQPPYEKTKEQREYILGLSRHIHEHYEHVPQPDLVDVIEDAREIISRAPIGSRVILLVDHAEIRPSSTPDQLKLLPWVERYQKALAEMVSQYPFAACLPYSDVIKSPSEILGENHYHRSVYFRIAQRVAELCRTLPARSDVGTSEFKDKWTSPQTVSHATSVDSAPSVPSGVNSNNDLPATVAEPKKDPISEMIDPKILRVPDELTVVALHPRRVLIVGSCLSEGWAHRMRVLPIPCESDVYLLGRDLPREPERPISDYDFQIVQLALRFVLPDASFARLAQSDVEGHARLFEHAVNGVRRFLDQALRWNKEHDILTFVFPFIIPLQNPMGRLLPRYDLRNPVFFIERLNEALAKEIENYRNVYFFDLNEIHSFFGRRLVQEDYYSAMNHGGYLSDFDFDHDANRLESPKKATELIEEKVFEVFTSAWRELVAAYRSVRVTDAVKMVVIDLDDTLWRGVVAEQDVDCMPTTEGWPKGFWESLLFLKRRGVLLAIISKNEESRVLKAWDKILVRQVVLEDFAIRRINWKPKVDNMVDILSCVNLTPGSVVYVDDSPAERAAMKAAFPDIRVIGGAPLTWRRILLWASETQFPTVTTESVTRTDMVQSQIVREEQRQRLSREDFLASLGAHVNFFQIDSLSHPRFSRAFELLNKTNQFNTTGKRWTLEECSNALVNGMEIFAFTVDDSFTDYGLVGVILVDSKGIRQFVMSCRIMGLDIEKAAVSHAIAHLRNAGQESIFAAMVETERNLPCRDLYFRCGFEQAEGGWRRSVEPGMELPRHIKISIADTESA